MKKRFALLLVLCLALLLCACSSLANNLHFFHMYGVDYEVDTNAQTISDGTFTYDYTFSKGSNSYSITITYPNGSTYSLSKSGHISNIGQSSNYSSVLFADGAILCDILERIDLSEQNSGIQISAGKVILVLFLAGAGIFHLAAPHTAWYLSRGWYYKDAEPSEAALVWTSISGAICILLAIIAVFMPI